jgi:hypothetical protein
MRTPAEGRWCGKEKCDDNQRGNRASRSAESLIFAAIFPKEEPDWSELRSCPLRRDTLRLTAAPSPDAQSVSSPSERKYDECRGT